MRDPLGLTEPIPLRLLADHPAMPTWLNPELVKGVLDALEAQVASGDGDDVATRAVRNTGLIAGESAVYLPSVKDKIDNRRPRTSNEDSDQGRTWQERAIERRLGDARALAVARSTRFMATALELVQESGQASFTLQRLADRANLSVRTFYQHFAGKDELLLALYEDLTAQFTEAIREKVEAAEGPMGQLEAWCRGVLSRPGSSQEVGGRLVLIYNLSLELDNPEAFAKVWEPHRKLLTEILTACSQAGFIRNDLTVKQLTSLLGSTLTSLGQYNALHGGMDETGLTEDVVWSWCRRAVLPAAVPRADDSAAGKQSTRN